MSTAPSPRSSRDDDDTAPAPPAAVDGRTLRSQRNREAVVEALLALLEEGELSPTAQRVAARAGVALRTVYGHFADMEALWLEAGRRELAKIASLADVPARDLPLAERLDRFCTSRARVLEALLPVMRATRLRRPSSPQLERTWARFVAVGDDEVRAVFAAELAPLAPPAAQAALDAFYLVSSAPAWDALRGDRQLGPEAAAAALRTGTTAVLAQLARDTPATPHTPDTPHDQDHRHDRHAQRDRHDVHGLHQDARPTHDGGPS